MWKTDNIFLYLPFYKKVKSGMKKIVLMTALGLVFFGTLDAQRKLGKKPIEFGIILGASNYMGELSKLVAFNETKPMGGLICRFNTSEFLTLRGTAAFGQVSGTDKNYSDDAFRKRRNLSFKSNILEFSGQLEWNIMGFGETDRGTPGSPYLFAGIGVFKYNPMGQFKYVAGIHDASLSEFDNQWVELQPLSTEGQETTKFNNRKRYSLTQFSLPLGVGYKKQFNDYWAFGIEFGVRKTFTDYIDDVSRNYVDEQIVQGSNGRLAAAMADRSREVGEAQFSNNDKRGNDSTKDWYMFLGFTLTRKIVGGKTVCFQF